MRKYDLPEESSSIAQEAALSYNRMETPLAEKIAYMKSHLHPSTVQFLEQHDFMANEDFPEDEYDEQWFDATDESNPVVPNDIVTHDREVWLNAI
jgi:hypothetical protein